MADHDHDKGRNGRTRVRHDVRIDTKPSIIESPQESQQTVEASAPKASWIDRIRIPGFGWVKGRCNMSSLQPVIRCAVSAWICAVLFVIPKVEKWMGQASFLILLSSFLSPPVDPFVAVLEREWRNILFVCIAWAWSCLGIKLASLSRSNIDYNVSFLSVIDGRYLEAAPSVIVGVFITLGTIFFLFIKARQGPGPYLFASIFGCICLDVTLTTAVLFPFPYYDIGRQILIPIGLHSVIALLVSLLIFPLTISSQFKTYIRAVQGPLASALAQHAILLKTDTNLPEFGTLVQTIEGTVKKAEGSLVGVQATSRLLQTDLIYCRFSPKDLLAFQGFARRLAGRVQGLGLYFTLIDPSKTAFPMTPGTSVAGTPAAGTPAREESPERKGGEKQDEEKEGEVPRVQLPPPGPQVSTHSRAGSGHAHSHKQPHHHHHHGPHHRILHNSLANLSKSRHKKTEHVVGVFESQKYLNLEAKHLRDPRHEEWVQMETDLLGQGCIPLLEECSQVLGGIDSWLDNISHKKFDFFNRRKNAVAQAKVLETIVEHRRTLAAALTQFRERDRMLVIEPYRPVVEHLGDDEDEEEKYVQEIPTHRHLFHCYIYQYHLIQISQIILEILDEIIRLTGERTRYRIWTPASYIFHWSPHELPEYTEQNEDDDPDIIQGVPREEATGDLGMPKKRDPDALPPRNRIEWVLTLLYYAANSLSGGNVLFAIKAGLLTTALCLPSLIRGSAHFAYENKWVWAIIMAQLTIARFRGDTTFGLATRVVATFAGGLIGAVMWYVASGSGIASPYAFAAVCFVCFPLFYMVWLYAPIPPMTRIMASVTACLVIGYSYQDTHQPVLGSPGEGWNVAWRRFVLVTIGVVAAFVASLLPPTMTLRRYQRSLLATTCTELGAIYCSIISFATEKNRTDVQDIIASLVATRSKLSRSVGLLTNVVYEFSLRGRWPRKRYQQALNLQIAISHSLADLLSVTEHLEPSWTSAFLRRTRFLDPDFQGDVLAVISMISSSLRNGNPLPQVTPCPLLDRFMMRHHGLDVIHRDSEEDYGLPRLLTLETLQDEQYMMFCVGIATAYSIMNRLDRLMLATKEIVGEQYHIHGIGVGAYHLDTAGFQLNQGLSGNRDMPRPLKDA